MALDLMPDFFDSPTQIAFVAQEENEKIELLLRRHWVTNLPWMSLFLIGLFVPALLANIDSLLGLNLISQIPVNLFINFLIIWFLFLTAYAIESLLFWYFNIYIVTNLNIISISFRSLLSKEITQSRLDDIQGVSSKMKGVFSSLFNFGDVIVETAAKEREIRFLSVPKPDVVADRIQDLQALQENGGHDDVS